MKNNSIGPMISSRNGLFLLLSIICCESTAWVQLPSPRRQAVLFSESSLIGGTERGRRATDAQRRELEAAFAKMERSCALKAPARSPLVGGNWIVEYTTAPPPSNGQLGPFGGIAYQEVDLETGRYANILKVSPNDWLAASLEARWEEWDGTLLGDDGEEGPQNSSKGGKNQTEEDYGATCWVVTFKTLTIRLFGFPLVTKDFDNVQRVWRTTYVDENTRILRAGRTGRREDENVFYMKRDE